MANLIIGIISDVLRHVGIEIAERSHIRWISSIDCSQLGVLRPQISLDNFGPRANLRSATSPLVSAVWMFWEGHGF